MLEWIYRGLSKGRITTRYPRRPEPAPAGFRGRVALLLDSDGTRELAEVCPTGAITVDEQGRVTLDRGSCILCGECVRAMPERFAFRSVYETAARSASALVVGPEAGQTSPEQLPRKVLGEQAATLRRSIHVRHIDCGSDGSEEWEIQALWNPYYDIQRLGFFLTNAPRHADVLLVTGPVTAPMLAPLKRTWEVMPEPKALVAVGTDACGGGLHGWGGVDQALPVDVYVPGSPPPPIAIMHGLLLAVGLLKPEAVSA
jgi:Ni,Fe-hydrogenase III small subunit/formate hydrogenlyase subunit 6/NADH:ubiquinone oxidoreductase subunit I